MSQMKLFNKKKHLIKRQLKKAKEIEHLKSFKRHTCHISKAKLMHQLEQQTDLKLFLGMMAFKVGVDSRQE